jgi:hypothetical protein
MGRPVQERGALRVTCGPFANREIPLVLLEGVVSGSLVPPPKLTDRYGDL